MGPQYVFNGTMMWKGGLARASSRGGLDRVLLAVLVAGSSTCGGDTGPNPTDASSMAAVSGGGQKAPVGAVLPESPVVLVTDQAGAPMSGIAVEWAASGGGSVAPAVDTTGLDGYSAARRTLGSVPGAQATTATSRGWGRRAHYHCIRDPSLAPPGHYMLFILNRNGVPSNGKVLGYGRAYGPRHMAGSERSPSSGCSSYARARSFPHP